MLCVRSGFPFIMNGCRHSLLRESAGSVAVNVPVLWVPALLLLLCHHAVYSTDLVSVIVKCPVRCDSEWIS